MYKCKYGAERYYEHSSVTRILSFDEKRVFGRVKYDHRTHKCIAFDANGTKLGIKDDFEAAAQLVAKWGYDSLNRSE